MKSVKLLLLIALIISSYDSFSQKKTLTIDDISINPALYARGLRDLQWVAKTDQLSYIDGTQLMVQSAPKWEAKSVLTLEKLNAALTTASLEPLKAIPSITWESATEFNFSQGNNVVKVDLSKNVTAKTWIKIPDNAQNVEYFKALKSTVNYSYTIDNDLYVNGSKINETEKDIVYGQTVHRNEFGIEKGTFWSPTAALLAFYKNDQTKVGTYPMVDVSKPIATEYDVKYPMAGTTNETVRIGIYNPATKKTVYLQTGNEDQYLTNISWDPSEKYLYVGILNRDQNHLKWQQFQVSNGSLVKTLFEEKDDKFVEPLHPFWFLKENPDQFIYTSWKNGFTHLYLYNTEGEELRQLTQGDFEVTGLVGVDETNGRFFFTGATSPLENHLYLGLFDPKPEVIPAMKSGTAVDLPNPAPVHGSQLTRESGQHNTLVSASGNYFINTFTNRDVPLNQWLMDTKGNKVKALKECADPLADFEKNTIEFDRIRSTDGQVQLYTRIIKPYNFDPSKKYPVIVYLYGGPHYQVIKEAWLGNSRLWEQYMAHKGFIIFSIDGRGSDNRGKAFEQSTHAKLGEMEIADQMAGIAYLKGLNYIDVNRIGVHGWSFGGFMTTSLMLKQPETFRVGVCGGPVIDWKYYEIMYTERYMDSPQQNPEGFEKANLLNYVEQLKGKLLIVHGTDDDVVVWQHTLAFVDKCVEKGVLFDYFPYPGHKHHVAGRDRIHLNKYMAQYFIDHL